MAARWTILLLGSLLIAAAGGVLSVAPFLQAAKQAEAPPGGAPTPELEAARQAVSGSMDRTVAGLVRRAEELELLSDLLAEAAHEPARNLVGTVSHSPASVIPSPR